MGDCLARQEKRSIGREEALWGRVQQWQGEKEAQRIVGGTGCGAKTGLFWVKESAEGMEGAAQRSSSVETSGFA